MLVDIHVAPYGTGGRINRHTLRQEARHVDREKDRSFIPASGRRLAVRAIYSAHTDSIYSFLGGISSDIPNPVKTTYLYFFNLLSIQYFFMERH